MVYGRLRLTLIYVVLCQRPNLTLKTGVLSQQSLILKVTTLKAKKAVGIEFSKKGQVSQVYASKEVILSAGSVGVTTVIATVLVWVQKTF